MLPTAVKASITAVISTGVLSFFGLVVWFSILVLVGRNFCGLFFRFFYGRPVAKFAGIYPQKRVLFPSIRWRVRIKYPACTSFEIPFSTLLRLACVNWLKCSLLTKHGSPLVLKLSTSSSISFWVQLSPFSKYRSFGIQTPLKVLLLFIYPRIQRRKQATVSLVPIRQLRLKKLFRYACRFS